MVEKFCNVFRLHRWSLSLLNIYIMKVRLDSCHVILDYVLFFSVLIISKCHPSLSYQVQDLDFKPSLV